MVVVVLLVVVVVEQVVPEAVSVITIDVVLRGVVLGQLCTAFTLILLWY